MSEANNAAFERFHALHFTEPSRRNFRAFHMNLRPSSRPTLQYDSTHRFRQPQARPSGWEDPAALPFPFNVLARRLENAESGTLQAVPWRESRVMACPGPQHANAVPLQSAHASSRPTVAEDLHSHTAEDLHSQMQPHTITTEDDEIKAEETDGRVDFDVSWEWIDRMQATETFRAKRDRPFAHTAACA